MLLGMKKTAEEWHLMDWLTATGRLQNSETGRAGAV
jgi:hypothetical protein